MEFEAGLDRRTGKPIALNIQKHSRIPSEIISDKRLVLLLRYYKSIDKWIFIEKTTVEAEFFWRIYVLIEPPLHAGYFFSDSGSHGVCCLMGNFLYSRIVGCRRCTLVIASTSFSFFRYWGSLVDIAWTFYMLHGNMQANFFYKRWKIPGACVETFCRITMQPPLFELKLKTFPLLHRRDHS